MPADPPLHVHHLTGGFIGETSRSPDVAIGKHPGTNGEEEMPLKFSEPVGGDTSVAINGVVGSNPGDKCA